MRKIGLIGGMSWASTELYYRYINKKVQRIKGGMCSAPLLIESLNFCDLVNARTEEEWEFVYQSLSQSAKNLEAAGASAIAIAANSIHRIADRISEDIDIPIIHIADSVGDRLKTDNIKKAALLGTRNVTTENWYRQRLVKKGVSLLPADNDRASEVDRIIYEELMIGKASRDSERTLKTFITNIDKQDVEAVVLGCTELVMVVDTKANILPIYDSMEIHSDAIVEYILSDEV